MQVFHHLVYEYQKGLRDLSLFTCSAELLGKIEKSLNFQKINYLVYPLKSDKINVFFGCFECLEIIKSFSSSELSCITPEEDFILGMMLGYAKFQQYQRFLGRKRACA
jgi:hypothetical protein